MGLEAKMPNRLVREGFLDSEAIDKLSLAAECFYHRLILVADDAGRVDARIEILRSRVYPLRDSLRLKTIADTIRECIEQGLCLAYDGLGKPYLQLTRWQRCGNAKNSRYPWCDGSFTIEYVTLDTRDGPKEFIATSISHLDPIGIPSISHQTQRAPPSTSTSTYSSDFGKGDPRGKTLLIPTVDEVRAYCAERKNRVNAQEFLDYYTANGWVQGKSLKPIKDWKAAVRYWEGNGRQKTNGVKHKSAQDAIDYLRTHKQVPEGCYIGIELNDKLMSLGYDGLTEPEKQVAINKCKQALEHVR